MLAYGKNRPLIETSYIGPNFNYAPMANSPATLTEEFHTAQTLLELHGDNLDSEEQNRLENSVISTELLSDAMDKVVDHLDTCPTGKLNVPDAMDQILEPSLSDQSIVLHVETEKPTSDTTSVTCTTCGNKTMYSEINPLGDHPNRLSLQSTSHYSL